MKTILIKGDKSLRGDVTVSGSKNSALPVLFATLITYGTTEIRNLPKIGDTETAFEILSSLGAEISEENGVTKINTENLSYIVPEESLVSKIRASTYLIGSLLSRFGKCRLGNYGGCSFSKRPIDIHLSVCKSLGAEYSDPMLTASRLIGAQLNLPKPSVGATVNALLLTSSAQGGSVIRGFAKEPHIFTLIEFLRSAGADITVSDKEIRVFGKCLHGGNITIDGDMIEAGSLLAAGIMTGGEVTVRGIDRATLSEPIRVLSRMGIKIIEKDRCVTALPIKLSYYAELVAEPYPGFPTDLQPIFASLFSRLSGGKIIDTVWRDRFGYLRSLEPFGVRYERITDGALIYPSRLHSSVTAATDLRGGMACILAALASKGESRIENAESPLRGYEMLEEKLRSLGADIEILN